MLTFFIWQLFVYGHPVTILLFLDRSLQFDRNAHTHYTNFCLQSSKGPLINDVISFDPKLPPSVILKWVNGCFTKIFIQFVTKVHAPPFPIHAWRHLWMPLKASWLLQERFSWDDCLLTDNFLSVVRLLPVV